MALDILAEVLYSLFIDVLKVRERTALPCDKKHGCLQIRSGAGMGRYSSLLLTAALVVAASLAWADPVIDGVYDSAAYSNAMTPTYKVLEGGGSGVDDYTGGTLAWHAATAADTLSIRGNDIQVDVGDVFVSFSHALNLVDNAYGDQSAANDWNNRNPSRNLRVR